MNEAKPIIIIIIIIIDNLPLNLFDEKLELVQINHEQQKIYFCTQQQEC